MLTGILSLSLSVHVDIINVWQRLISRMLDMNVKDWSMREVVLVANIIGALASQLSGDSEEVGVPVT